MRVSLGTDADGNSSVWRCSKDWTFLLAEDRKAWLQEEEADAGRSRRRWSGTRARAHVRVSSPQRESLQTLVEVCHWASCLLPFTITSQGSIGSAELLQNGLEVPLQWQDRVSNFPSESCSTNSSVWTKAFSKVRSSPESCATWASKAGSTSSHSWRAIRRHANVRFWHFDAFSEYSYSSNGSQRRRILLQQIGFIQRRRKFPTSCRSVEIAGIRTDGRKLRSTQIAIPPSSRFIRKSLDQELQKQWIFNCRQSNR